MMRRAAVGLAAAGAVAAVAAFTAPAGAQAKKKRCAPAAKSPEPTLTSPCNGATIVKGHNPTFTAYDKGVRGQVYIELTKRPLKRRYGSINPDPSPGGFFRQMKAVKGHPGRFTYRDHTSPYDGLWRVTPGTYHVQLDHVAPGKYSYGPVTTIHVR